MLALLAAGDGGDAKNSITAGSAFIAANGARSDSRHWRILSRDASSSMMDAMRGPRATRRWLGPSHEKREGTENGRQQDAPERDAEEIPFGEEDVAEQQDQAKREKKDGLEQEVAMRHRQVTIHRPEQDEAVAMTRVEADPGLPHRCLSCDARRHLLHAGFQIAITGKLQVATVTSRW